MADLNRKDEAMPIQITNEAETVKANVTPAGELSVSNFANVDFQDALKTITTTEALASVGASNLANRKTLVIYNKGNKDLYYGTTGVTNTTGMPVLAGDLVTLNVGENINVYIKADNGTTDVIIQEFS